MDLTFNIDLEDFLPTDWPNSGPSSASDDRIVLHELTHAVMARTMDMQELPLWFIEGTAEFSYGDDARLYGDITNTAGGSTAAKVETLVNTYLTNDGSVEQYSAGYAAVRYMHKAIVDAVEVAELTRTQILQQAGISILSQANSSPRQVLQLLQT